MKPSVPERERRQRAQAALEKSRRAAELLRARGGPPDTGDLLLLRHPDEAAELEWVVVRTHPDSPSDLLLVPTDDNPLVGSTDVAVPGDAAFGPLVLRCGHGVWLARAGVADASRVGFLEERHLARARRKLRELAEGPLESTTRQRETDADPDYADWIERVADAADALEASRVGARADAPEERVPAFPVDPALEVLLRRATAPDVLVHDARHAALTMRHPALASALSRSSDRGSGMDPTAVGRVLWDTGELVVRVVELRGTPDDERAWSQLAVAVERRRGAGGERRPLGAVRVFAPSGAEVPGDEMTTPVDSPFLHVRILAGSPGTYRLTVEDPPHSFAIDVRRPGGSD